jgi:hypothetical protein
MNIFNRIRAKRRSTRSIQVVQFVAVRVLRIHLLFGLLVIVQLSACGSAQNRSTQYSNAGVAVLGVSAKIGLETAINRNGLATDFTKLLVERRAFPVLPSGRLRQYVGADKVTNMLNRFAETGRLDQRDINALMAADLPTPRIVLARLEEDYVVKLPARREVVLNRSGELLADRERKVLATQRVTRVSATLVDLRDGRQIWNRHFRVDPVAEATTTQYLGSSFSGSLAAAFANTMVNGIRVVRYPAAPSLRLSMVSLLREIAENLPIR